MNTSILYLFIFQNRCRKLVCPISTAPFYGQCKTNVRQINNLCVFMVLRLNGLGEFTRDARGSMATANVSSIASMLHAETLRQLGMKACTCYFFVAYSQNNSLSEEILLSIVLSTTKNCQLETFFRFAEKRITVRVSDQTEYTFSVSLDKRLFINLAMTQITRYRYAPMMRKCSGDVRIAKYICPAVNIRYSELLSKTNDADAKGYHASLLANIKELNENSIVSVCVDDYFKAKGQTDTSSACRSRIITIILGLIGLLLQ